MVQKASPAFILVRDNDLEHALKVLKKSMQTAGVFREMKLRSFYEKPSEKRIRKRAEARRRVAKAQRKAAQRELGEVATKERRQ
jgi:small subunit ribosomal protein S21